MYINAKHAFEQTRTLYFVLQLYSLDKYAIY